ncbi:MAG: isocitrate dehydrogenase [Planctomycetota bacterium]|jgi:isocitrate dehydrogenase
MSSAKITWTKIDEAPALATHSLLPVLQAFTHGTGVEITTADISLAGRILANFPENLTEDQKIPDELQRLGELAKTPDANIIKLPNISASIPQLQDAIEELQKQGYDVPSYPGEAKTDEEKALQKRFAVVLGSAVNPVLREGNSDRRPAASVKSFAQKHPHRMMKDWPTSGSKSRVAFMESGDFFDSEKSVTLSSPTEARIEFTDAAGTKTVLKDGIALLKGEVIDAATMSVSKLREYFAREIASAKEQDVLFSLHLKATMMKVSDPAMFGHCVAVYFKDALDKHSAELTEIGANLANGLSDVLEKLERLPEAKRKEIEADIAACYETGPALAMVDSRKGITNLHLPNNVIIDASMPVVVRDGGKMWNRAGELQDTVCLIPDRSYATLFQSVIEDCQANGQFDPSTMGNVANVGLMAKKAEEYGSHDKTFFAAAAGTMRVVDAAGATLLEQPVEEGDIFRMCQTKDEAIRDWVKLGVTRARAAGTPAIFWLDADRGHDAELLKKVHEYLKEHDTDGLDIQMMRPVEAMAFSLARVRKGEDTISVTGNVLRDYLTDLFPILELGTSARMLSIVPLLQGGGLFETGAGGSAPKHVEQFIQEGHLRWDSLGEYCAIVPSLEKAAETSGNKRAALLAETLDQAIGEYLENSRYPSRKVGEIDNRGSAFYLTMYWAQALAGQSTDAEMKARFEPVAKALVAGEAKINGELLAAQGSPMDLGGYYHPSDEMTAKAMRPSETFNGIIDGIA